MGAALRPSEPPPSLRAKPLPLRKPSLDPERDAADSAVCGWFKAYCLENRISVDDLKVLLRLKSRATAYAKWSGEKAPTLADIRLFPSRDRHYLASRFLAWCDAGCPVPSTISHG
jgi:hypothetical protein